MQGRNKVLDLMKLIYMFPIVFVHANYLIDTTYNWKTDAIFFPSGYVTVEFFFIVSGVLMAAKAKKIILKYSNQRDSIFVGEETLKFTVRKYIIVFPFYILPWVAGFTVNQFVTSATWTTSVKNLAFSAFTFLQINMSGLGGYQVLGSAWQISAMLLSAMILFPILLTKFDYFVNVFGILTWCFLYGYIAQTRGRVSAAATWDGLVYVGLLRAVGCMALGGVCYNLACKIRELPLSKVSKILISVVEIFCYIAPFIVMYKVAFTYFDFPVTLMFSIAVTITYSQQSYTTTWIKFNNAWMAKYSISLCFVHMPFITIVNHITPTWNRWERLPLFLVLSVIAAIVNMWFGSAIIKLFGENKAKIKSLFVRI